MTFVNFKHPAMLPIYTVTSDLNTTLLTVKMLCHFILCQIKSYVLLARISVIQAIELRLLM